MSERTRIVLGYSCGVVAGHEHRTPQEAQDCIDIHALAKELATALDNLNWLHGAIKNTKVWSQVVDALAHARDAGLLQ